MSQGYQNFFRSAKKAAIQPAAAKNRAKKRGFDSHPHRKGAKSVQSDLLREEVLRRLDRGSSETPHGLPDRRTPEVQLRDQLQKRIKARAIQQKKKAPFPVLASTTLFLILSCVAAGFIFPDAIDGVFNKLQIGFLTSATAAEPESNAKSDASGKKEKEKAAATGNEAEAKKSSTDSKSDAAKSGEAAAAVNHSSNEEMSFFNKLSERKKQLDQRESELTKLEEELHKQRVELDGKIQQLETMRKQIAEQLQGRVVQDQEKVNKLVEFYSSMKPQQAAKVIESLNEDLAVEILDKMKKKSAAEILNTMEGKKAQKLSESLAGYRRPAGQGQ